ncbi:hypothetical protein [Salinivibrio phage CW02]|uniref:Uncharacterized protein n=1 Tax=Salinivibrio phage CW02 TaxID=1161935 RepID=H9D1D4_9CAUD|nr:hypothetical protein F490_gp61 [Salinivibrio phage CW02]AFE86176.1 hypothetical protein [Salinivibrio phage CW02]
MLLHGSGDMSKIILTEDKWGFEEGVIFQKVSKLGGHPNCPVSELLGVGKVLLKETNSQCPRLLAVTEEDIKEFFQPAHYAYGERLSHLERRYGVQVGGFLKHKYPLSMTSPIWSELLVVVGFHNVTGVVYLKSSTGSVHNCPAGMVGDFHYYPPLGDNV